MDKAKWGDIRVDGIGPKPARIAIVGESPGANEVLKREPFVGGAGRVLDSMLEEAGILRSDCYITNISKYRPVKDDFGVFYEDKKREKESEFLKDSVAEVICELQDVDPWIVIALGAEPLRLLTGRRGITNWRGSVVIGSCGKTIGTYHPAAVMRNWSWRPVAVIDLKRAKEQSEIDGVVRRKRELVTGASHEQLIVELGRAKLAEKVSFDIETESNQISSLSFSVTPSRAVCVPFWFGASGSIWSVDEEMALWEGLRAVLEGPSKKIAQNAQYDMLYLRRQGISVKNLWMDTMVAFHLMYPELPKGLDFICSIYTDQPYYKYKRGTDNMREFFEYNCLDACVTYEAAECLEQEMREYGVYEFYHKIPNKLLSVLFEMTVRGVKVDLEMLHTTRELYKKCIEDTQKNVDTLVGHELNVYSHKQMTEFLYKELKLKEKGKYRKARDTTTVAADETVIREFYKQNQMPVLKEILTLREKRKIYSTYLEMKLDEDKRVRTVYDVTGTETGRLASRTTPLGTGMNLQNIPKDVIRKMFVPDKDKVFVSGDLSQAEARVVAYDAQETVLIDVFNSGGDIHKRNASKIFRKTVEEVIKEERQLAKRIVHASNYGMGPAKFAQTVGVSLTEAKRLLNQYFATYPRIKLWHMSIAQELRRSRMLVTPMGRKRMFLGAWNEALLREAYAYVPQSTVSDILNEGLIELDEKLQGLDAQVVLQVHDSVVVQCLSGEVCYIENLIRTCLERDVVIHSRTLRIPVDICHGNNWEELK